jgi:hypothetical protein
MLFYSLISLTLFTATLKKALEYIGHTLQASNSTSDQNQAAPIAAPDAENNDGNNNVNESNQKPSLDLRQQYEYTLLLEQEFRKIRLQYEAQLQLSNASAFNEQDQANKGLVRGPLNEMNNLEVNHRVNMSENEAKSSQIEINSSSDPHLIQRKGIKPRRCKSGSESMLASKIRNVYHSIIYILLYSLI